MFALFAPQQHQMYTKDVVSALIYYGIRFVAASAANHKEEESCHIFVVCEQMLCKCIFLFFPGTSFVNNTRTGRIKDETLDEL
jgi:hypothetical protein